MVRWGLLSDTRNFSCKLFGGSWNENYGRGSRICRSFLSSSSSTESWVTAITTTDAKADKLNKFISPIQDDEIERFFSEANAGERKLNMHTTTDKAAAYGNAELVIIATPTAWTVIMIQLHETKNRVHLGAGYW